MATLAIFGPAVVAPGESFKVRAPVVAASPTVKLLNPSSREINYTGYVHAISTGGLIGGYEVTATLQDPGQYLFRFNDGVDTGFCCVTVSAWAGNIDAKISDIKKQRTDLDRLHAAALRRETT